MKLWQVSLFRDFRFCFATNTFCPLSKFVHVFGWWVIISLLLFGGVQWNLGSSIIGKCALNSSQVLEFKGQGQKLKLVIRSKHNLVWMFCYALPIIQVSQVCVLFCLSAFVCLSFVLFSVCSLVYLPFCLYILYMLFCQHVLFSMCLYVCLPTKLIFVTI